MKIVPRIVVLVVVLALSVMGVVVAAILPSAEEHVVKEAIKRVLACQEEINQADGEHAVSISLGSATAENADQFGEALRVADSRMYYYKKRRKQR